MNKFKEYDVVVSNKILSKNVLKGCRGAVLICYYSENNEYEIEFVDANGETIEVLTVSGSDLELEKTGSEQQ